MFHIIFIKCSRKHDYVKHPTGKSAMIRKCIDRVGYTEKNKCYATCQSDRNPDKEVCGSHIRIGSLPTKGDCPSL